MGKCPGRKNPESRCDGGQKLPEQRGNELSGAHRVTLSGLCRIAGRTEIPMSMEDWAKRLDGFLEFNGNELLTGPGKISAEQAKLHAETEYEKYRIVQDCLYESDFDRFMRLNREVNQNEK